MSATQRRGSGAGERKDRKERSPREEKSAFIERVVAINRVSKVVKGGRRFSFTALVIVGDVDPGEAMAMVREHFGGFAAGGPLLRHRTRWWLHSTATRTRTAGRSRPPPHRSRRVRRAAGSSRWQ